MQASLFDNIETPVITMPDVIPPKKHPTAKQIIDKILNVKKSNISRLSAADRAYLDELQGYFTQQNDKLDRWEMLLKFEMEAQYSGRYKIEKEISGNYFDASVTIEEKDEENTNPFEHNEFNPRHTIENVMEERYKLQKNFHNAIISHFNKEYDLNVRNEDGHLIDSLYTYEPIVDIIFSQLPSGNLHQHRLQSVTEGFIKMKFGNHGMVLDKHKVQFDNVGFYKFDMGTKEFKALFTSLGYFETGEAGSVFLGEIKLGEYKHSQSYAMNGKKVVSIRFYNTGKTIIYFTNEVAANEFYNLF